MINKHRSEERIIYDFLSILNENHSIMSSRLFRKINLSNDLFKKYLSILESHRLINKKAVGELMDKRRKDYLFSINEKSVKYMKAYEELRGLLK